MAQTSQADPDKVELLISHMMAGLKECGEFSASDGVSAALTFAMRFCRIIVALSADEASKQINAASAVRSLRIMAAELEAEVSPKGREQVH